MRVNIADQAVRIVCVRRLICRISIIFIAIVVWVAVKGKVRHRARATRCRRCIVNLKVRLRKIVMAATVATCVNVAVGIAAVCCVVVVVGGGSTATPTSGTVSVAPSRRTRRRRPLS